MEQEFKQIQNILDELYEIQANHLESFNKTVLPDIEQQSADREKKFRHFKKRMVDFIHRTDARKDDKTESMLSFCSARITSLIDQNKSLETKVRNYRDRIRTEIGHLSKGKQVISKYGSPKGMSKNPRVISISN